MKGRGVGYTTKCVLTFLPEHSARCDSDRPEELCPQG